MNYLLNSPLLVLTLSFVTLWLSELIGASFRKRRNMQEGERDGFSLIAAATLTLLGLIIGFAFSMAISGYDQRQSYEEAEAGWKHLQPLMPARPGFRREHPGRRVFQHLPKLVFRYIAFHDCDLRWRALHHQRGQKCFQVL